MPPKAPTTPFTLLFVGTLNYFPNADALAFLCDDVLPLLRQKAHRPFVVSVIGGGAADVTRHSAPVPEVRLIGRVSDLAPWYHRADVAIVPIQTGGGTRIKVLEAFKYGRPVVSTSVGVEGLAVKDGEHVLVGDTPEAFAEHCLRLMADSVQAELLARNASFLFRRAYTTEVAKRSLAACHVSEAQVAGVTPAAELMRSTNRVRS